MLAEQKFYTKDMVSLAKLVVIMSDPEYKKQLFYVEKPLKYWRLFCYINLGTELIFNFCPETLFGVSPLINYMSKTTTARFQTLTKELAL